ncbi:hypothetical protein BgiMline_008544, partial [Biomphalaria glabrata]
MITGVRHPIIVIDPDGPNLLSDYKQAGVPTLKYAIKRPLFTSTRPSSLIPFSRSALSLA